MRISTVIKPLTLTSSLLLACGLIAWQAGFFESGQPAADVDQATTTQQPNAAKTTVDSDSVYLTGSDSFLDALMWSSKTLRPMEMDRLLKKLKEDSAANHDSIAEESPTETGRTLMWTTKSARPILPDDISKIRPWMDSLRNAQKSAAPPPANQPPN